MAFFKATRDQWKANAFVSNLEFANAKFQANDLISTQLHLEWALAASKKMKAGQAGYILSREGWIYVIALCQELDNGLLEAKQHRLHHISSFLYSWALWNEDQIEGGGRMSKVRSGLLATGECSFATNEVQAEPEYAEDNAETRIGAAIKKQAVELDLSALELTSLPVSLGQLTGLQTLYLTQNQLASLPEWIAKLTSLRILDLSENPITSLPQSLNRLTDLYSLSICNAQLTRVPERLHTLTQVQELYLSCNQFASLPESLGDMASLRKLILGYNRLETLPESLGKLIDLEYLDLEQNRLRSLPESLGNLPKLSCLDISGNLLTGPAESFGKLAKLLEHQFWESHD